MNSITLLFDFFLGLVNSFAQAFSWLTTNLPYLNVAPLDLLSFGGLTLVIGFLVIQLVVK